MVYAVSEEGIQSLRELELNLKLSVFELQYAAARMMRIYERAGADLGVFEKDLLECLREVLQISKKAEESIEDLIKYGIEDQIERVSELLRMLNEATSVAEEEHGAQYVKRYPR